MKTTKEVLAILIVAMMIVAMLPNALAEGDTITITNTADGYAYTAYQIFTGTISGNKLTDIQWATGISDDAKNALKTLANSKEGVTLDDTATAADIAKVIAEKCTSSEVASALGNVSSIGTSVDATKNSEGYAFADLSVGYYFIKSTTVPTGGSHTEYILEVLGDTNLKIAPKGDVPTMTKKVMDKNDTDGSTSGWIDSADYDIGDSVPFQLKATLPSNVESYTSYNIEFLDTMEQGLTYNAVTSIKVGNNVIFDGTTWTDTVQDVRSYVAINGAGQSLSVKLENVKKLGATNGTEIVVEFTATLNSQAVLGATGNKNTAYLKFSNNPNVGHDDENGQTPPDTVIVFTYKFIVNKTDADNHPLEGATFKLEKITLGDNVVNLGTLPVIPNEGGSATPISTFEWVGLDDGQYRLTEISAPAGYNKLKEPIVFSVVAGHVELSENVNNEFGQMLTSLTGNKVSGEIDSIPTSTGLALSVDVVNQAGNTLPSTGGMGTTIFYVVGSILVIGAVVLLVSKKRMNTAE